MQFLVGKFTCEMSLDDGGNVVARWFRSDGRAADVPKKLALRLFCAPRERAVYLER
jgi:hypothetical protein